MKVKKIELNNILNHKQKTLTFQDSGLIGITGPNAAGKSNILRVVKQALINKSDKKLSGFLRRGAKEGNFKVEFEVHDKTISVERSFYLDKDKENEFQMDIDGTIYTSVKKGYAALFSLLNTHADLLNEIVLAEQGSIASFLFDSSGRRKERFQLLLGLNNLKSINSLVGRTLPNIEVTNYEDVLEEVKGDLEENKKKYEAFKKELGNQSSSQVSSKIKELNKEIKNYYETISIKNSLEGKKQDETKEAKKLQELNKQIESLEKSQQEDINTLREEIENYKADRRLREKIAAHRSRLEPLEDWFNQRSIDLTEESVDQYLTKLQNKIGEGEAALDSQNKDLKALNKKSWQLEQLYRAEEDGECPVCENTDLTKLGNLDDLEAEGELIQDEISTLGSKIDKNQEKLGELGELKKTVVKNWKTRLELQTTIKEVEKDLSSDASQITTEDQLFNAQDFITRYDSLVEDKKELEKDLEETREEVKTLFKELQEQRGEVVSDVDSLEQEKEELNKEYQDIVAIEGKVKNTQEEKDTLTTRIKKLEKQVAKESKTKEKRSILSEIKDATRSNQLPLLSMQEGLKKLNKVFLEEQEELNLDLQAFIEPETCDVKYTPNGSTRAIDADFSKGQMTCLSVAFVLALWKSLLPEVSFLALDEPSGWLDPNNLQSIVSVLGEVKREISQRQILLISHREPLKNVMDSFINVA